MNTCTTVNLKTTIKNPKEGRIHPEFLKRIVKLSKDAAADTIYAVMNPNKKIGMCCMEQALEVFWSSIERKRMQKFSNS